jgi:hypothetical protein
MRKKEQKVGLHTRFALTFAYFFVLWIVFVGLHQTMGITGFDVRHYYGLRSSNTFLKALLWFGWVSLPVGVACLYFRRKMFWGLCLILFGFLFEFSFLMFDAYWPRYNFDVVASRDFAPGYFIWFVLASACAIYIYRRETQLAGN